jgi:Aspartyl protease/PDZ domain
MGTVKTILVIGLPFLWLTASFAKDAIEVDAKVNGQPVRLEFDTGASRLFLNRQAADRLGLKPRPEWISVWSRPRAECLVTFMGSSWHEAVGVFDLPVSLKPESDGVLGWPSVSGRRLMIDALHNRLVFGEDVPEPGADWTQLPVWNQVPRCWGIFLAKWKVMALKARDPEGKDGFIIFDTGSESGIGLSPSNWRAWKASHTNQPLTLTSGWNPHMQMVIREQSWTSDFSLGGLRLNDVVVEEADSLSVRWAGKRHIATLGMAAIKRLDVVVDGPNGVAYLRPKQTPATPYDHNRLGAVFLPRNLRSEKLIARVVSNSPAAQAGIRDGDVLLQVDKYAFTNWRTNDTGLFAFWQWPTGTKLNLRLARGEKTFETTVVLRNLLGPAQLSPVPQTHAAL